MVLVFHTLEGVFANGASVFISGPWGMSNPKLLSIVVATRNRPVELRRCLRSLERLTYPHVELLVVDDHSTESLEDELGAEFPQVRWVRPARNVGTGPSRNIGARLARGGYLWFLDDDAEVLRADAAKRLVEKLAAEPDVAGLGGEALIDPHGEIVGVKSFGLASNGMTPGRFQVGLPPDAWVEAPLLVGCNLMVRRDDFRAVGGFDPTYELEWEDTDLCVRLRAEGKRLLVAGFAPVLHHFSEAERRSCLRALARGRAYFVAKNAPLYRLLAMPLLDLWFLMSPRRWSRWIDKARRVEHGVRGRVVRPSAESRLRAWRLIAASRVALEFVAIVLGGYLFGWGRVREGIAARRNPPNGWEAAAALVGPTPELALAPLGVEEAS